MRRDLLTGLALAAIAGSVLAGFVCLRIAWDRMEAHCTATPPGSGTVDQVEYSLNLFPPGFMCTYTGGQRDGDVETVRWL